MQEQAGCDCAICGLNLPFLLDPHLMVEIEKYNCVIFAGAGISTETQFAHPDTLYEALKSEVNADGDLNFCELVDQFEAQPNGRQKFVELVTNRFDYIDSFRDLRSAATKFHRALGNAPYFGTIITTNWDRYFEDVIGATPFVYDSDVPFWSNAKRSVLKIHGSIDNYSSLVASSDDYEKCEKRLREGALGAVLKQIFATKTCIFCGYSAKDQDFRKIFSTIKSGLGQFARAHYLISPFIEDEDASELLEQLGIVAIKTDATYFIEIIKEHMRHKSCFSGDDSFNLAAGLLADFREMHEEFVSSYDPTTAPHLIYATAYQDGVIHALERIVDREFTGEFSDLHKLQSRISGYAEKISECVKNRNYWDCAYFQGYQNGLIFFVLANDPSLEEVPNIPPCYHPGQNELELEEFETIVRHNPEIHKNALRKAVNMTSGFKSQDTIVQHLPWG